jgi:leader peptidase (prepilin peptidase)/N-methyltransferase
MLENLELIDQDFPLFFTVLAAIFGAITGSFLNVCIYRIPAGRSIIVPGSSCACGQRIPFYHNIPILSWCLLRGRAHCCGARFSIRYPAIELLTAILFCTVWIVHPPAVALVGMLFIAFLICATFIDFDHMIIPDRFSIGGMIIGVGLSVAVPSLHAVSGPPVVAHLQSGMTAIIGALIGAGLVYWVAVLGEIAFRKPAMGEGDVKFVGFIGAFCGWEGALFAMFGGAFIGSAVLLPVLLVARWRGQKRADLETASEDAGPAGAGRADPVENAARDDPEGGSPVAIGAEVPFGPMLALAGLLYFIGLSEWVDAYLARVAEVFLL